MFKRTALFALIFAIVLGAGSTEALAARPGGNTSAKGSVSLVLMTSTDGLPHYGQQVTFNVSTSVAYPYVNLKCWQGGAFVGEGWRGFFPGSLSGQVFTLSGTSLWVGTEAADCTAYLVYQTRKGSWMTLASTSFHVDP